MNFSYSNIGSSTYLRFEIQPEHEVDTMSLGMLTNNKVPGFAVTSYMQMDTAKFVQYNVTSKVSAAQLFSGPVNKKRLIGVFTGIVKAMMSAEEYMIDPATIMLDMDYIFTDVSTCETILICVPVMETNAKHVDLSMFFKNIIFTTQFDQTENCDHVAQIINYLNRSPIFSLTDFKSVLEEIQKQENPKPAAPQPAPQPVAPVQPAPQPVTPVQPAPQPAAPVQPAPQPAAPVRPAPQPVVPVQAAPVQRPVVPEPKPASVPQPTMPKTGFQIPGQAQQPAAQKPAAPADEGEKEMTLMYLMQHYNKENAAIYKAQQDAKKAAEKAAAAAKAESKKAKNQKAPAPVPAPGFQIPGQAPTAPAQKPGFQIPGQAPTMPKPAQPVMPKPTVPVQPPVQKPVQQPAVPQPAAPQPVIPQPVIPAAPMNFGETTVLGGGGMGETTVLGAAAVAEVQIKPYLIRSKNNEKINLDKPVFRIGKEKSYVDYFIGDNTAISRSHANIIDKDGEYFIVDTNSTNHTYVNGGMIQSNVETKISHDTKIRLANEEFTFKLY